MPTPVLVTFATRYGSTQEVAQAIAKTLRECGVKVDLQRMPKVRTLSDYQAIVMGMPIYATLLHKDAVSFLKRHAAALPGKKVALFVLGPIHTSQADFQESQAHLAKELAKYAWLKPELVGLFGGKYDPTRLRFPDTMIADSPAGLLYGEPACDIRDWVAIDNWAHRAAEALQVV